MTRAEVIELMKREGFWNPTRLSCVAGTAKDITKRVDEHFRRLHIYPYKNTRNNGRYKYTGELLRSIYWEVFNRSGGDEILLRFYMSVVAKFVETGSQALTHTTNAKEQIEPTVGVSYSGITRKNDRGETQHRKAKPFISSEIRIHGRMLFERLLNYYGAKGYMLMITPFFDRSLGTAAQDDINEQMRFEITHGGWKKVVSDLKNMDLTK